MPTIGRQWYVTTGRPNEMYVGLKGKWTPLASEEEAGQWLAGETPTLLVRSGIPGDAVLMRALCESWGLDGAETVGATQVTPFPGDAFIVVDRTDGTVSICEVEAIMVRGIVDVMPPDAHVGIPGDENPGGKEY